MAQSRVAVVTGANKGIGFSVAKKLCRKFDGSVCLTARDPSRGERAINALKKDGHSPRFHQLDITDADSVASFAEFIRKTYGGLDVLVNNAGLAYGAKEPKTNTSIVEQAKKTIRTNFVGTNKVCRALFPLLRPHARVVNISSSCGMLAHIPSTALQKKLKSFQLTFADLNTLMDTYVRSVNNTRHVQDWGKSAYVVSKVGVTALTKIQQRQFEKDTRPDLVVNAVHPGFVETDMTKSLKNKAPLSPDQGSEAPVYLCLLPPNISEPKGRMVWFDKKVVDWGMAKKKLDTLMQQELTDGLAECGK